MVIIRVLKRKMKSLKYPHGKLTLKESNLKAARQNLETAREKYWMIVQHIAEKSRTFTAVDEQAALDKIYDAENILACLEVDSGRGFEHN